MINSIVNNRRIRKLLESDEQVRFFQTSTTIVFGIFSFAAGFTRNAIVIIIYILVFIFSLILNFSIYKLARSKVIAIQDQAGGRKYSFQVREASQTDAHLLHDTLVGAFTATDEFGITPPAIFAKWLQTNKVIFRIIEKVGINGSYEETVGFYSIYPLRVESYYQLLENSLDHDSISDEHMVRLSLHEYSEHVQEPVVLFILDIETLQNTNLPSRSKMAASYLFLDLTEQVRCILLYNNVVGIAALGASPEGKAKCLQFGLSPHGEEYFPHVHGEGDDAWYIYERQIDQDYIQKIDEGLISKNSEGTLAPLPWQSEKNYPYFVDENTRKRADFLIKRLKKNLTI